MRSQGRHRDARGAAVIWVAATLAFLLGAAALAVDVSGFYQTARTEQNAADMACLAGVRNLPQDATAARREAAEFIRANWAEFRSVPLPSGTANPTVLTVDSKRVEITGPLGVDDTMLRVDVFDYQNAHFGRILNRDTVLVARTAQCAVQSPNNFNLPFGVLPGPFNGILSAANPCGSNSGNCQQLDIPRLTASSKDFRLNIALGVERTLKPASQIGDVPCASENPCSVIKTFTGVSTGQLTDSLMDGFTAAGTGIDGRLTSPLFDHVTAGPQGEVLNNDSLDDIVLEWSGSQAHILNCASPRLARVPILERVDGQPGWPSGSSQPMRIIGFYWVRIDDPNGLEDFQGSKIKAVSAEQFEMDPDARCAGSTALSLGAYIEGGPKVARLVQVTP